MGKLRDQLRHKTTVVEVGGGNGKTSQRDIAYGSVTQHAMREAAFVQPEGGGCPYCVIDGVVEPMRDMSMAEKQRASAKAWREANR